MEVSRILDIVICIIPVLITGGIFYFFFKEHIKNEDSRRDFLLEKEATEKTLSLRLQAYERLVIFLERVSPSNLLIRMSPGTLQLDGYENLLINTIEKEFEHNLSQQIYVSDKCWHVVVTSKNSTIQMIRKASMLEKTDSANKLREVILTDLLDRESPSNTGLSFIRKEVSCLWK